MEENVLVLVLRSHCYFVWGFVLVLGSVWFGRGVCLVLFGFVWLVFGLVFGLVVGWSLCFSFSFCILIPRVFVLEGVVGGPICIFLFIFRLS